MAGIGSVFENQAWAGGQIRIERLGASDLNRHSEKKEQ